MNIKQSQTTITYFYLDLGNTPAHCAASGHMPAMNCLVNHGCDMTITNHQGDTPDMVARKHGHTLANHKAGMIQMNLRGKWLI